MTQHKMVRLLEEIESIENKKDLETIEEIKTINIERKLNIEGQLNSKELIADEMKLGQGEIEVDRVPELIMFKCVSGTSLKKGDKALVLELIEAKNYYIVEPYID